ncbi:MAG: hypothetical protein NTX86_03570 [Candidatus Dependentiae bacterium]|nr:hypothetical protein [Candidatus Dependentiae bacterium]
MSKLNSYITHTLCIFFFTFQVYADLHQNPATFILMIPLYNETNIERQQEYKTCLERNLHHPAISTIHVLYDRAKDDDQCAFLAYLKKQPITISYIDGRPTFAYCFDLVNQQYPERKIVLSNADIYFNETLDALENYDLSNRFLVLTRWDAKSDGSLKIFEQYKRDGSFDATMSYLSHDVWIFKTPLRTFPDAHIQMGTWACDGYIAYQALLAGLKVINPCLSIQGCHLHNSGLRHWIAQSTPGRKALIVDWCTI